jgi:hypothetical protein
MYGGGDTPTGIVDNVRISSIEMEYVIVVNVNLMILM